jgi:hypothetical protein
MPSAFPAQSDPFRLTRLAAQAAVATFTPGNWHSTRRDRCHHRKNQRQNQRQNQRGQVHFLTPTNEPDSFFPFRLMKKRENIAKNEQKKGAVSGSGLLAGPPLREITGPTQSGLTRSASGICADKGPLDKPDFR